MNRVIAVLFLLCSVTNLGLVICDDGKLCTITPNGMIICN